MRCPRTWWAQLFPLAPITFVVAMAPKSVEWFTKVGTLRTRLGQRTNYRGLESERDFYGNPMRVSDRMR